MFDSNGSVTAYTGCTPIIFSTADATGSAVSVLLVYPVVASNLFIQELNVEEPRYIKVNKNYFIPVQKLREELINEILKNGEGW